MYFNLLVIASRLALLFYVLSFLVKVFGNKSERDKILSGETLASTETNLQCLLEQEQALTNQLQSLEDMV